MIYDYLIVGGGLFGSTFAYKAKSIGKKCLVIDKRKHIGGNLFCENISDITVHTYGPHIFHTNNQKVWDFVSSFVSMNNYINSPLAYYQGSLYNLPFNMNTFYQIWGITDPNKIKDKLEEQIENVSCELRSKNINFPQNLEQQALLLVGRDIYEILIKGYTEKQWGRSCEDLPADIIKRLPIRFTFNNNYFNDKFQGIPIGGYNKLIDCLLQGIEVITNVDYFDNKSYWDSIANKVLFTGCIDEYYGYRFGKLEYRSVLFDHKLLDIPNYQGNAIVNYTDKSVPYTRCIEHKHFEMFNEDVYNNPKTVISFEHPVEFKYDTIPSYPINNERNNKIYQKYKELADNEHNVIFGGRLTEYKYYDMDDIIERVFTLFDYYEKEYNSGCACI